MAAVEMDPFSIGFIKKEFFRLYQNQLKNVQNITLKDKRYLFKVVREHGTVHVSTFFPSIGMTAGEFMFFDLPQLKEKNKE